MPYIGMTITDIFDYLAAVALNINRVICDRGVDPYAEIRKERIAWVSRGLIA